MRLLLLLLILAAPAWAQPKGTVVVTCSQGEAQVTIDGRPAGRTPVTVPLSTGPHRVRVERPGAPPFETVVTVAEGQTHAVEASSAPVEGPGQVLYLDTPDPARAGRAWAAVVKKHPSLKGAAAVGGPNRGWTGVASKALAGLPPEEASAFSRALSAEAGVAVLHLAVSPDDRAGGAERAWYFLSKDGRIVDRYCSNPGRPGEVGHDVLRSWAGRPDLLLPLCRGTPLSKSRSEVSLTDLNAVLYFYYPEMKQKAPASWRSAGDVMKLLTQVVGVPQPPAPFGAFAGWKPIGSPNAR